MRKSTIIILTTMILNSVSGQNLNGKWLLKDINSGDGNKGYPGFQMLEINDKSAEFFTEFSLEKKVSNLKLVKGKILTTKNGIFAKYKIINENHLRLFIDGKSNDKDAVFEYDFYRLMPTITTLKKEEIEKITFLFKESETNTSEFKFNIELMDAEILKLMKKKEGHKMLIEKIDSTLFIGNYHSGKRDVSFPIKEVTREFITLYAIPTGPMELTAYRKE